MKSFICLIFIFFTIAGFSQDPSTLPLFTIDNLNYKGGFRLPASTFGTSSLNYSEGPIEYNADHHSIFIVSHSHDQAIAEFSIPEIVDTEILEELNMADSPIQLFSSVLSRAETGNTQNIDRIGGLEYMNQSLLVNGYEYYDADGGVTVSTLLIENSDDISNSAVKGFFSYDARAGNTSGWISPIPAEWQDTLSGTHITGQSSGIPIISRTSVGPTAYSFNAEDFRDLLDEPVSTAQLLDFSYPNGMQEDLSNTSGENDQWTHLSWVRYGFIIPGTRTYFTIGKSGGHESGVCYKCTQDNGNLCGGYCTPNAADNYQYYWLWDMNDLLEVMNGGREAYSVEPYEFGKFNTPFQNGYNSIGGGSYDAQSNLLYLSINGADRGQGTYANPPVIVAYEPMQSTVVPVEWISFEVTAESGLPELNWEIDNDILTDYFEIERINRFTYTSIGKINANGLNRYFFQDRTPPNGIITYRIKQVDLNGNKSFSESRNVDLRKSNKVYISPNPVNDFMIIHSKDPVLTRVLTSNGVEILQTKSQEINLSGYAPGIYLIIIEDQYFKIVKN